MERNKTSLVVLVILAGFFFIAIAMIFNTSVRRDSALKKQESVEEKIAALDKLDLTIYWIGDVPAELGSLKAKMQIIKPEEITKDNMPIRTSTFHITVKSEIGTEEEIVPRNYSEYMLIVINTAEGFTDISNEVLRNCIVENGVPVLGIGGPACNYIGTILIHGAGYAQDYSMFYKLKEGYEEPFLEAKAVSAGGVDLAEDLCGKLCAYFNDAATKKWIAASERVSSAYSSIDEAATATTESSETEETGESTDTTDENESGKTTETAEISSGQT